MTGSVESLTALLAASAQIRQGGLELQYWSERVLEFSLEALFPMAAGGLFAPQIGYEAIVPKSFDNLFVEIETQDLMQIRRRVDEFTHLIMNGNKRASHTQIMEGQKQLFVAFQPIIIGSEKDNPVGLFWAAANSENIASIIEALKLAAAVVRLGLRAEKASSAVDLFGTKAWISAKTTQSTAKQISSQCRQAVCCEDVIVWEVQEGKFENILTTLANTTNETLDMPVGRGIAGTCALGSEPITIKDLWDQEEVRAVAPKGLEHPEIVTAHNWHSAVFIPLDIGSEIVGVLGMYFTRPNAFSELDLAIGMAFAQRLCAGYVHVKRLEELVELERKLELAAPAMEGAMLAMEKVHDANNYLVFAQGLLTEIAGRFSHEKRHGVYRNALGASSYLKKTSTLLKRLADYASARRYYFKRERLDELLEECQSDLKDIGEKNNIRFTQDFRPRGLEVEIDREYLQRAFFNVLNNAVYFLSHDTKRGTRKIAVSYYRQGSRVVISVKDNGPGIAPNDLPKVFDYLFTTRSKGMGFGLPITKRIVDAHGGTIAARSRWGSETTMEISLPIRHTAS